MIVKKDSSTSAVKIGKEQKRAQVKLDLDSFNSESVKDLYRKRLDETLTREIYENT